MRCGMISMSCRVGVKGCERAASVADGGYFDIFLVLFRHGWMDYPVNDSAQYKVIDTHIKINSIM